MKNLFKRGKPLLDLTGQTFNKLIVLRWWGRNKFSSSLWMCRCDCGKYSIVPGTNLKRGTIRSCGCLKIGAQPKGEKSTSWKGGRRKTEDGYILITVENYPKKHKDGYIFEHIFVMSQLIGRLLLKGETVHHKNGVRDDNDPDNLELRVNNHGQGQNIKDLVPYWKKMLILYEPVINKL